MFFLVFSRIITSTGILIFLLVLFITCKGRLVLQKFSRSNPRAKYPGSETLLRYGRLQQLCNDSMPVRLPAAKRIEIHFSSLNVRQLSWRRDGRAEQLLPQLLQQLLSSHRMANHSTRFPLHPGTVVDTRFTCT